MTKIIIEQITKIEDLQMFSKAYRGGMIQMNISKLAKHLKNDRKTIKRYLEGNVLKIKESVLNI